MKSVIYVALWVIAGTYFGVTAVGGSPFAAGLCMWCGYMAGTVNTKRGR